MNITIYSLHPLRLLFFSWGSWLIVFLLIPASYTNVEYSLAAITSLFSLLTSFILGVLFFEMLPKKASSGSIKMFIDIELYKRVFYIVFFLGFFGVLLKLYEHFIIHHILSQSSLFAYKMSRMQNEFNSGIIGVISALTYPFGLIALMLNIKFQYFTRIYTKIIIWAIGCYWFFDALFLSSMMAIIFLVSFIFITVVINSSIYKNKAIKVPVLSILLVSSLVVSYFIYLTSLRIDIDAIAISLNRRELIPTFNIDSLLIFALINFLHYLAHGVVEWFRLFSHVGLDNYYLGMYEFYPVVKIFSVLGFDIPSFSELASIAHKTGVYITFWGGFILDFGYYSFFISFVLGVMAMSLYTGLLNGSFTSYLIYPVFAAQLIFSSIVNIFSGVVVYYLVSILITIALLNLYKRNLS